MYKIYVAGAITGDSHTKTFNNIGLGIKISAELLKEGFAPFCPFLDYQYLFHEDIDIEQFYNYSMEFLKICDVVLVIGKPSDYNHSVGTKNEIETAQKFDIPVLYQYCLKDNCLKAFEEVIKLHKRLNLVIEDKPNQDFTATIQ